jgi:hypothetical protein
MLLIAQMRGHLLGQRPFQHGPGHLGQQAVRAQQLHALGLRLAQQLISQLLINQRGPGRFPVALISGHPWERPRW